MSLVAINKNDNLFHYFLSYAPFKCNFNMKINVAYDFKSICPIHLIVPFHYFCSYAPFK
jgi:hypothetical protein